MNVREFVGVRMDSKRAGDADSPRIR